MDLMLILEANEILKAHQVRGQAAVNEWEFYQNWATQSNSQRRFRLNLGDTLISIGQWLKTV